MPRATRDSPIPKPIGGELLCSLLLTTVKADVIPSFVVPRTQSRELEERKENFRRRKIYDDEGRSISFHAVCFA